MKCHKTKRDGFGHIDAIGLRASAKKGLRLIAHVKKLNCCYYSW